MWPDRIVVVSPAFDEHLGLLQRVEDLSIEQLVSELPIEGLVEPVLPWASGLDEQGFDTDPPQPRSDCIRRELRAIIGSDVIRWSALDEQVGKQVEHIVGAETTGDRDRQAFPRILVDDGEHPERLSIVCSRLDEVIGPDVVWPARPEADARAVVLPYPPSLWLLVGNLQPLAPPDAFHALVVHDPTFRPQHRRDPSITVAAILTGQTDDRRGQRFLIVRDNKSTPLRRTRLPQKPTSLALRKTKLLLGVDHTMPAALGAYQFPSAASLRTSFSTVRSATARRRRPFSRSTSFRRRA